MQASKGPSIDAVRMSAFSQGSGQATLTGQGYARLQEFGGVIRPVRARALTIPTALNVGADGLPKYKSAAALRGLGRTILVTTKRGQFVIMVREGGEYRPMWILRQSVRIPARLGFYRAWRSRDAARRRQLRSSVAAAIKGR